MGPHSFKCGKGATFSPNKLPRPFASMGPHSFKCGKMPLRKGRCFASNSFNGAALFQVRKDALYEEGRTHNLLASMGPHSFKCGKRFF